MKNFKLILLIICILINIHTLSAQIKIHGIVSDSFGPLPGVNVKIKGQEIKSTTNFDGIYKITVPDSSSVIEYSYLGYDTEMIKVNNKDTINVLLKETYSSEKPIMVGKPVIYLYPLTRTNVSLKLNFSGDLYFTYPDYNNGWNVIANPDGNLINKKDGKEYSYLFWDGKKIYNETEVTYDSGFIVNKDSIVNFLQNKLSEFGLIAKEYNEFIVYWTPFLMKNDLNFIHFKIGSKYETISMNEVNPKPETEIRIFMDFKKIDASFEIEPQKIKTPNRKGFTLVEWGGTEISQPIKVKIKNGQFVEK